MAHGTQSKPICQLRPAPPGLSPSRGVRRARAPAPFLFCPRASRQPVNITRITLSVYRHAWAVFTHSHSHRNTRTSLSGLSAARSRPSAPRGARTPACPRGPRPPAGTRAVLCACAPFLPSHCSRSRRCHRCRPHRLPQNAHIRAQARGTLKRGNGKPCEVAVHDVP